MRSFQRRLRGLLALLALVAILAGMPTVLVKVGGNPLPQTWPTLDQARAALLAPDDGSLVLAAAVLLGWIVWAALAVSILLEISWQVRGRRPPALPGLALPQGTARALVSTALALFVAAPLGAGTAAAAPAATHVSTTQTTARPPAPITTPQPEEVVDHQDVATVERATRTYRVAPGDTLWSIAQTHLGSGHAYAKIVELNPDKLSGGADWIRPGMELTLPAAPPGQGPEETVRVTVAPGDTLSGLAEEHLHDGTRWPELYQSSTQVVQPDGRTLSDPDLIYPGWQIVVPGTVHAAPEQAPPAGATAEDDPAGAPAAEVAVTAVAAGLSLGQTPAVGQPAPQTRPVQPGALTHAETAPSAQDSANRGAKATETDYDPAWPAWLLSGLVGSGALLGGGVFLALASRRRTQFRHRRPGRTIQPVEPALAPVEMTVQTHGASAAATVQTLDEVLRRLGERCTQEGAPLPVLAAAQLQPGGLTLHLAEPATLPDPWRGSTDQLHWHLPVEAAPDQVGTAGPDAPAPYPLLVSIGSDDDGTSWLLNLEDLQLALTGDEEHAEDLARYLAAEIAVNPWSAGVRMDCVGIAAEVHAMNPERINVSGPEQVAEILTEARDVSRRLDPASDVATARASGAGADPWPARALLIGRDHLDSTALEELTELIHAEPGRTGTAIIMRTQHPEAHTVQIIATPDGRLVLPEFGLDLVGVGLTPDEARGCAALLSHGTQVGDAAIPVPATEGAAHGSWRDFANQAGALRPEHTLDRGHDQVEDDPETHTLLPEDDRAYLDVAATTSADLATLAPHVPDDLTDQVLQADPTLDEDLAAWWDPQVRLPKLTLLGPVSATTWGRPMADRKPYFTELLTYLALHPDGVTPAQTAEAFSITVDKCRDYVRRTREWLGTNPRTGQLHLPHATDAPATQVRGINLYQVQDVIVDADLFRRLRTRGEASGGQAGIQDLREALRLVQGEPFTQLRRGGWAWLFEGDRLDQHLLCGIVDVAHILTVHHLQEGDHVSARAAAHIAAAAAPHEEIPTLDLAAVAAAEGSPREAARILQREVSDRTDQPDEAPGDLPERTQQILDEHGWLDRRMAG